MLFVCEQAESLIMEVTALRCKVADLHRQLNKQVFFCHSYSASRYRNDDFCVSSVDLCDDGVFPITHYSIACIFISKLHPDFRSSSSNTVRLSVMPVS